MKEGNNGYIISPDVIKTIALVETIQKTGSCNQEMLEGLPAIKVVGKLPEKDVGEKNMIELG